MGDSLVSFSVLCPCNFDHVICNVRAQGFLVLLLGRGKVLSPLLLVFLGPVALHSTGKDMLLVVWVLIAVPLTKDLGIPHQFSNQRAFPGIENILACCCLLLHR